MDMPTMDTMDILMPTTMARGLLMLMPMLRPAMDTMATVMLPMPMDMPTMDTMDILMPTTMARGLLMLMPMLRPAMDTMATAMLPMPMDMPTMATMAILMPTTDTTTNLLTSCKELRTSTTM